MHSIKHRGSVDIATACGRSPRRCFGENTRRAGVLLTPHVPNCYLITHLAHSAKCASREPGRGSSEEHRVVRFRARWHRTSATSALAFDLDAGHPGRLRENSKRAAN